VRQREFEILKDGQIFEHGRPLEFAADAEIGDFRLVEAGRVRGPLEETLAGIGPGLTGDDVHHRGLAGAVRADDRAQFAFFHDQRKLVQSLEPIEADRDAVEVEKGVGGGGRVHACPPAGTGAGARGRVQRACRKSPTIPRGNTNVVRTNRAPSTNSQGSGAAPVSQVFAALTRVAATIAPDKVPRPPTETQIATSIEFPGENSPGLMMPT